MRSKYSARLLATVPVLVAAIAFAVVPATASAAGNLTITHAEGGEALATGSPIEGVASNLDFTLKDNETIECKYSSVDGGVEENAAESATVEIEHAELRGDQPGEECEFVGAPVKITPKDLPWKLSLNSDKTSELIGDEEGPVAISVDFLGGKCEYVTPSVFETFTTERDPLELTIGADQVFDEVSENSEVICPRTLALSTAVFELTSNGEELEATV